jgi:hypothetical protein
MLSKDSKADLMDELENKEFKKKFDLMASDFLKKEGIYCGHCCYLNIIEGKNQCQYYDKRLYRRESHPLIERVVDCEKYQSKDD